MTSTIKYERVSIFCCVSCVLDLARSPCSPYTQKGTHFNLGFNGGCQNCICLSKGLFWQFFSTKFNKFCSIRSFNEKLSAWLSKLHSQSPKARFENFLKKYIIYFFPEFEPKVFGSVVKTALSASRGIFLAKKYQFGWFWTKTTEFWFRAFWNSPNKFDRVFNLYVMNKALVFLKRRAQYHLNVFTPKTLGNYVYWVKILNVENVVG